jgi:hypothetical protein
MNDDQARFARKLAACLDRGAAELRPGTLYQLQQARGRALARVARSEVTATEFAVAGAGSGRRAALRAGGPVRWLGIALLVGIVGFGYQQWHAVQQVREFEELDLHLLASDLPIDAYLDRGFQNWLRNTFDY